MEIRVSVLGKVAYKQGASRDDKAKAELYPSGEGVYAVMDGDDFVCLRVVSSKIHDDTKGDNLDWSKLPLKGKQNERTDADRFKDITDKMSDTYKRKNHDYGNAFSEMYDELGINYGYGKIREKVNRIKTLKDNEAQVANEPLEDALLDCANYCILTLMEYQKRKEHGTD